MPKVKQQFTGTRTGASALNLTPSMPIPSTSTPATQQQVQQRPAGPKKLYFGNYSGYSKVGSVATQKENLSTQTRVVPGSSPGYSNNRETPAVNLDKSIRIGENKFVTVEFGFGRSFGLGPDIKVDVRQFWQTDVDVQSNLWRHTTKGIQLSKTEFESLINSKEFILKKIEKRERFVRLYDSDEDVDDHTLSSVIIESSQLI